MDEKRDMKNRDIQKSDIHENEETNQPTRWYCDTDCRAANRPCRGEKGKDPTAKNLCPYYEDMLF